MKQRIGTYITQKVTGEAYKAYLPPALPPEPPVDLAALYPYLEKATEQTLEYMKRLPQVTVPLLASELRMTAPTARTALNHMTELGIIEEMSGKKRDKVYVYRKYLDILEEGAEPFRGKG